MYLENIVWDAREPRRLGAFWARLLNAEPLTEEPDIFEARVAYGEDFYLDLCFPRVDNPSPSPARLHPDIAGGARQAEVVDRALRLGAEHADVGQGEVDWVVLNDIEGNAFCVMEERDAYRSTGPIAALPLDSSDPQRDAAFWAEISGWVPYEGNAPATLRHPSGRGPLLEFYEGLPPKTGKNRMHLDVRRQADDTDALERVAQLGASELKPHVEGLPWTIFADLSGNEFCVLAPYDHS